ncbi:MAG: hypothetical protein Q7T91_00785 [Sulfuricurvum sp.]|nr:hypothetical protein [Sulfuricurvum sp.]
MVNINDVVLINGCYLLVKNLSDDGKIVEVTSGGKQDQCTCSIDCLMQNNEKIMSMYECLEDLLSELDAAILLENATRTKMKKVA